MTADQIAKLNAARAEDLGMKLPDAYAASDKVMTLPCEEYTDAWERLMLSLEEGEKLAVESRPDRFEME